jgi:hypothetical protein
MVLKVSLIQRKSPVAQGKEHRIRYTVIDLIAAREIK